MQFAGDEVVIDIGHVKNAPPLSAWSGVRNEDCAVGAPTSNLGMNCENVKCRDNEIIKAIDILCRQPISDLCQPLFRWLSRLASGRKMFVTDRQPVTNQDATASIDSYFLNLSENFSAMYSSKFQRVNCKIVRISFIGE